MTRKIFIEMLILVLFCSHEIFAADPVLADPDHISTGYEYRGVADVRLGDTFKKGFFSFGCMADIRNESRFNQGPLPNHNWRGFGFVNFDKQLMDEKDTLKLTAGLEHESAHPTMGFNDGNVRAYDKVYDSTYRTINMNSCLLRLSSTFGRGYALSILGDVQGYFLSRNTPELPLNDLTWSESLSGGFEFRYPVKTDIDVFASGFDRYIFQSRKKINGNIYYDTNTGVTSQNKLYPIINNMNTISFRVGVIFESLIPGRKISVYSGYLYGNIFGFVDSREKRSVYSVGIEIFQ